MPQPPLLEITPANAQWILTASAIRSLDSVSRRMSQSSRGSGCRSCKRGPTPFGAATILLDAALEAQSTGNEAAFVMLITRGVANFTTRCKISDGLRSITLGE
jgi:hypothetical protein